MFGEQLNPSKDQKSSRSHLTFKPWNVEMNEPERLDASEVKEQTSTRGLTDATAPRTKRSRKQSQRADQNSGRVSLRAIKRGTRAEEWKIKQRFLFIHIIKHKVGQVCGAGGRSARTGTPPVPGGWR